MIPKSSKRPRLRKETEDSTAKTRSFAPVRSGGVGSRKVQCQGPEKEQTTSFLNELHGSAAKTRSFDLVPVRDRIESAKGPVSGVPKSSKRPRFRKEAEDSTAKTRSFAPVRSGGVGSRKV